MKCVIGECSSRFTNGIRSHCLPKKKLLRQKWCDILKIIEPGPNDRVCSLHFRSNDYKQEQQQEQEQLGYSCQILTDNTLPTKNLPKYPTVRGYNSHHKYIQKLEQNKLLLSKKYKKQRNPMLKVKQKTPTKNKNPIKSKDRRRKSLNTHLTYTTEDDHIFEQNIENQLFTNHTDSDDDNVNFEEDSIVNSTYLIGNNNLTESSLENNILEYSDTSKNETYLSDPIEINSEDKKKYVDTSSMHMTKSIPIMNESTTTFASKESTLAPDQEPTFSTNLKLQKLMFTSVRDRSGFKLHFDDDVGDDERRFYLKLFPLVNLVGEKKTHCTSCNAHLGCAPNAVNSIRMHPILKVTQCKKCNDFYNSGEFSKGEDGSELYCRWCGQGGEVYCCAKCPFVFCKSCISMNLAKSLVADIRDNETWNCFVCSPKITWPIRATHWALTNYIQKQKLSIQSGQYTETQIRALMKKDTSQCCPNRTQLSTRLDSDDDDDDLPLAKAAKISSKKRKSTSSTRELEPKAKQSSVPALKSPVLASVASSSSIISKSPPILVQKPQQQQQQQFVMNNQLVINPVTNQTQTYLRSSQPGGGGVKIVQVPQQQVRPTIGLTVQQSQPPPLLIRNRGIQIRQHSQIATTTTTPSTTSRTTTVLGGRTTEQQPVYHTIGGFCIDLNSAAQHDSIRLPNGKLIQVKKSTTANSAATNNLRNQIPSGVLQQQPQQQQHHFTITQPTVPIYPQQQVQSIPSATLHPNSTSLQIVNGNQVQLPNQLSVQQITHSIQQQAAAVVAQQQQTQQQQQSQQQQAQQQQAQQQQQQQPRVPVLVRHTFNQAPVGKARNQLQNQIFTAMEICQHLSGKIQSLTNSNPYKNANNLGDVKELYIHLSYLFTYAIGRFKTLQEKCNDDMKNFGYKADHTKLVKGHMTAEKEQTSDTEEGELELIEPQTTTINLDDSDDEGPPAITVMKPINKGPTNIGINNQIVLRAQQQQQELIRQQRKQLAVTQAVKNASVSSVPVRTTTTQQLTPQAQKKGAQTSSVATENSGLNDNDVSFNFLAGMLEVELDTDGQQKNPSKPKQPRKKTTNKPNPTLIRQQQERYAQIKYNDFKLNQQRCKILINNLDLSKPHVKSAMKRYASLEDENGSEIISRIDLDDDDDEDEGSDPNDLLKMLEIEVTTDNDEVANNDPEMDKATDSDVEPLDFEAVDSALKLKLDEEKIYKSEEERVKEKKENTVETKEADLEREEEEKKNTAKTKEADLEIDEDIDDEIDNEKEIIMKLELIEHEINMKEKQIEANNKKGIEDKNRDSIDIENEKRNGIESPCNQNENEQSIQDKTESTKNEETTDIKKGNATVMSQKSVKNYLNDENDVEMIMIEQDSVQNMDEEHVSDKDLLEVDKDVHDLDTHNDILVENNNPKRTDPEKDNIQDKKVTNDSNHNKNNHNNENTDDRSISTKEKPTDKIVHDVSHQEVCDAIPGQED